MLDACFLDSSKNYGGDNSLRKCHFQFREDRVVELASSPSGKYNKPSYRHNGTYCRTLWASGKSVFSYQISI